MRFGWIAAAAACVMAMPANAASILRVTFAGEGIITALSQSGPDNFGFDIGDAVSVDGFIDFGTGNSNRPPEGFTGTLVTTTGAPTPVGPSAGFSISGDGFAGSSNASLATTISVTFENGALTAFSFINNDREVVDLLTEQNFGYAYYDPNGGTGRVFAYGPWTVSEVAYVLSPLPAIVPEPATWAMLLIGTGALGGAMRRKRVGAIA